MQTNASEGKQYAYIPKNTFYAFGAYTVSKGMLKGLGVNLSTSFQDKVYRNSDNTSSFDAYWLTDLGLSYTLTRAMCVWESTSTICSTRNTATRHLAIN